ncbi:hypothetical protein GQ53DRAFT_723336 [Thozetella sp. PMI_491]|nr:hypothetical protein GQ53DRAFT_723336 [Thozetella sp. PMI_491]
MAKLPSTSLTNPALLQKIDKLREHNIGQHVPLPQLVVVGDQSSGKSSLLESLTGIPFPRNVELCTRHATQITSRRDNQNRVEIRIIPGPHASEEHKHCVESYVHTMSSSKDLRSRFLDVLKEANTSMGIRTDMSSKSGSVFSEDVLKIEICGPQEDYLTVIDVPGIFRNHTEGVTTKDDMHLVNNLVRRYIKDKRTIILAVLPSNIDVATQEIIALAEEYDKLGERTLGVLTKPDLVTEYSAKVAVCNLVSGTRRPLSLGYYLVRNRGADDQNTIEHASLELLFRQDPWASLPAERVGISALKEELSRLLAHITRREFPSLRKEISEKLADCQRDLDRLGPARPNEKEQRAYLSSIARNFADLTRGALNAQYAHHRFFEKRETRLITCLTNLTGEFRNSFQRYGKLHYFGEIGSEKSNKQEDVSESESLTPPLEFHTHLRESLMACGIAKIDKYPELSNIVTEQIYIEETQDGVMEWIKVLYLQSRGMDLGGVSPDLLSFAFTEQSRQWKNMARAYMGEAIRLIHQFMDMALQSVCADDEIAKEVWSAVIEPVLERYNAGLEQALLLVDIERYQHPYTLNNAFSEGVQRARGMRMREILRSKAWWSRNRVDEERMVINLDDVLEATKAKTNEEYLEEEIHDKLESYYSHAVDRFMDNIVRQAVGYHLLIGPLSPLTVFSQEWVIDLDIERLGLIAGEKDSAKKRRQMLAQKRKDLKNALDILKA